MKHLIFFLFILVSSGCFGQIQDHNIKIRPDQDSGSPHVLLSDSSGTYAGRGRWYTFPDFVEVLEQYLEITGGISDGDKGDITVSGDNWQIDAGAVGNTELAADAVTSTKIAPSTIQGSDIATTTITGGNLVTGTITTLQIFDGTITQNDLANNSVGSGQIINGQITSDDIGDGQIIPADIADGSIGAEDLEATGVTASTYLLATVQVDEDGRIVDASTGAVNIDGTMNGDGNGTPLGADTTQYVATKYDLTQIEAEPDADFHETGTTDPPNAITDDMFHTGPVSIGGDGPYGAPLNIQAGIDAYALKIYGIGSPELSTGFYVADDGGFQIHQTDDATTVIPFQILPQTPNGTLTLESDGDVVMADYPNSRDDGTPTNFIGTDASGTIQSYPIADAQLTTEQVQDIVGAMVTGNTETNISVTYEDSDGTLDFVVSGGGGSSPYVISPSQITADQDDYAPAGIGKATHIRLSGDNGLRAITGIADSTAGELTKRIFNTGSYMIYFPMDHPDSDAAHRFTGWQGDFYLYPGESCEVWYDVTSTKWRIQGSNFSDRGNTLRYRWDAASTTGGDFGDVTIVNVSGGHTSTAATTSLPAHTSMSTTTSTSGTTWLYFAKTVVQYSAFGSAHQYAEAWVSIPTLSDGTETYTATLQISNTVSSSALEGDNTVGFRYSNDINSGRWQLFTQDNAAAEDVADSGVTVAANTLYKLRIEYDKSRSELRGYIDGVYIGRVTGNMPNAVVTGSKVMIKKSAGSTARTLNVHSFQAGAIYP